MTEINPLIEGGNSPVLIKAVDVGKLENDLTSIADSVRAKGKTTGKFTSAEAMKLAIDNISTNKPEETKSVKYTTNGKHDVLPSSGKVMTKVSVEVAVPSDQKPELAGNSVIKENGKQTFTPPVGNVYSSFTADVQVPQLDTSSATAIEEDVLKDKTYYAKGIKKTGTFDLSPELLRQDNLINEIATLLHSKVNVKPGADITPFKSIQITQFTGDGTATAKIKKISDTSLIPKHIFILATSNPSPEFVSMACGSKDFGSPNGIVKGRWYDDAGMTDRESSDGSFQGSAFDEYLTFLSEGSIDDGGGYSNAILFESGMIYMAIIFYK